jgi:hypothetical protein
MKLSKLLFLIILLNIITIIWPFFTCVQSAPSCFISNRTVKYYLSDTALVQYSIDGRQIKNHDYNPIYTCPERFEIVDFDWAHEGQTGILGVLLANAKSTILEIIDLHNHSQILIKNMTFYHPWKLQFADVDHDSVNEICLGVFKKSPLHPILTKRLFIFNFHHGLQPKWLGSRLSHPFTDFDFQVARNRTILVALELNSQDQPMLNAYEWDCFGFMSIPAHFDVSAAKTSGLYRGYIFDNGLYRQSLFTVNNDRKYKKINMNLE